MKIKCYKKVKKARKGFFLKWLPKKVEYLPSEVMVSENYFISTSDAIDSVSSFDIRPCELKTVILFADKNSGVKADYYLDNPQKDFDRLKWLKDQGLN